MNKRPTALYRLIVELLITVFLIFFSVKINSFFTFAFLPFVVMISGDVLKNIFILKGKDVDNKIFNKLYFIGILLFTILIFILCIVWIILSKHYLSMIFCIPFFGSIFFFIINKLLDKDTKINTYLFLTLFILIGVYIICSSIGNIIINGNYESNNSNVTEIITILLGIIIIIFPLCIIISMSHKIKEKILNLNIDIISLLVGISFLIASLICIYFMTGTLFIIEIFKSFTLDNLIPCLFMLSFPIFGIFIIIKSFKNKK